MASARQRPVSSSMLSEDVLLAWHAQSRLMNTELMGRSLDCGATTGTSGQGCECARGELWRCSRDRDAQQRPTDPTCHRRVGSRNFQAGRHLSQQYVWRNQRYCRCQGGMVYSSTAWLVIVTITHAAVGKP